MVNVINLLLNIILIEFHHVHLFLSLDCTVTVEVCDVTIVIILISELLINLIIYTIVFLVIISITIILVFIELL